MYATGVYGRSLEREFREPHEWWDAYVADRDAAYAELIKGKTCLNCSKCRVCERDAEIGYCTEDGEFRYGDETIEEMGMECYEED